jgi:hypothetical protein
MIVSHIIRHSKAVDLLAQGHFNLKASFFFSIGEGSGYCHGDSMLLQSSSLASI